jgi:hypothetical protein
MGQFGFAPGEGLVVGICQRRRKVPLGAPRREIAEKLLSPGEPHASLLLKARHPLIEEHANE